MRIGAARVRPRGRAVPADRRRLRATCSRAHGRRPPTRTPRSSSTTPGAGCSRVGPTSATAGCAPGRARRCTTTSRGSRRWPTFVREVHDGPGSLRRHLLRPPAHRPRPRRSHRAGHRRLGRRRPPDGDPDAERDWMAPAAGLRHAALQPPGPGDRAPAGRSGARRRPPHCPVAMLAVDDDVIGIQAHPEFGAPYVRALLEDRVDRIGEAGTAAALESLERPPTSGPSPAGSSPSCGRGSRTGLGRRPDLSLTDPGIGARFDVGDPSAGRLLVRPPGAPPRRTEGGPTDARWSCEPGAVTARPLNSPALVSTYLAGPPTACSTLRRLPPRDS